MVLNFYICYTALNYFSIVAVANIDTFSFSFTTVTTGLSEYCDYSLKGMLDAAHGLHQLISQFSRNMQRPVCNNGVLSQTKTQPSLSLEFCCAMLAKCHQESCHRSVGLPKTFQTMVREEWKNL